MARKKDPVTATVETDTQAATLVDFAGAAAAVGRTPDELDELRDRKGYRKRFPAPVATRDGVQLYDLGQVLDWAVWLGFATRDGQKLIGYREIAPLLDITEDRARHLLRERRAKEEARVKPLAKDIIAPYDTYVGRGPGPWPRPMWLERTGDPETGIVDWIADVGRLDPQTGDVHHHHSPKPTRKAETPQGGGGEDKGGT